MQRLSYPTETGLSNKITTNWIVLSFKDSPRKPLERRPFVGKLEVFQHLPFLWEEDVISGCPQGKLQQQLHTEAGAGTEERVPRPHAVAAKLYRAEQKESGQVARMCYQTPTYVRAWIGTFDDAFSQPRGISLLNFAIQIAAAANSTVRNSDPLWRTRRWR